MLQFSEKELARSRDGLLQTLGLTCYNSIIDGTIHFPEMRGLAGQIQRELALQAAFQGGGPEARDMEAALADLLRELGCVCFNLYVDQRLFPPAILSLCSSVSDVNRRMEDGIPAEPPPAAERRQSRPWGMEPIPANYIRCVCGYRNRSDARYCARCGAKLQ